MLGISPKEIILKQLYKRFEQAKIKRVVFTYTVDDETITAEAQNNEGKPENLPVDPSEKKLIRGTLIKNIQKEIPFEFTHLIADINSEKKTINLYAKDLEGELIPFEV
jgi:hypothetical protein